ncbi:MAG: GNAT family N-acetyltransferase [Burkholderiales bacterium]
MPVEPVMPSSQPIHSPANAPKPDQRPPADRAWVPIRSLGPRHRERIMTHLMALDVSDRYLRFGYPATDAQMSKYVDMLDFDQDEVFGIFNRRLELIAMAHLAHAAVAPVEGRPAMSEFGVSVLPQVRSRGFGRRLFEHAMLHARNRGVEMLFIHALTENVAMLKIARRAGATVERDGSESDAWLKLPPDSLASHVGEMVEQQAAELDYHFKLRARQVGKILGVVAEVKTSMGKVAHIAEE